MFRKKPPKRLYYPTKSRWYNQPKKRSKKRISRRVFADNVRMRFTRFFKNALYFAVSSIFLFVVIIVLGFSSYFSIIKIEVIREDFNIDTATITNQLNSYIGKNILFFSRQKIVDTIVDNFPEFFSVNVKKILPNTIRVDLESYPIVANLRAYYILPKAELSDVYDKNKVEKALEEALTLDSSFNMYTSEKEELVPIEQKSLLNRIGQAIFDHEENLELITVTVDDLTQPIEDREIVIPSEKMDYILDSVKYFNNLFEMQVSAIRYLPNAREIRITTDAGIILWLITEKDYKKQIDKLNIIYDAAELNKEDVAYIDLRVREKVIYCLRGTRCDK